jgi:DNA-binding MarR family transcriptional regulator
VGSDGREELARELTLAMQRGTMWTVLLHHTVASKAGINVTDAQCLNLLVLDGPMTPGRLAQAVGITTGGAITAVVDRLEEAGYVTRARDPDDRRRVIVSLVPENIARIAEYFRPIAEVTAKRLASYSDAELNILLDYVKGNNQVMPEVIKQVQEMP